MHISTMKKTFMFDPHTHPPYVIWSQEVIGKLWKQGRKNVMKRWFPMKRNLDTFLQLYLPKTKEGNVAINLCSMTQDRFADLLSQLQEASEKARLKRDFALADIDLTNSDYFLGFKTSQGREFYIIRAQEPHAAGGHAVIFPVTRVIHVDYDQHDRRNLWGIIEEVRRNEDITPIVAATHPCMKLSLGERGYLELVNERDDFSVSPKNLERYIRAGLIDAIEINNAAVGTKHNNEIEIYALLIALRYGIPMWVGSDTYSPANILTNYDIMDMDFHDAKKLTAGIRNNLQSRKYDIYVGKIKNPIKEKFDHGVPVLLAWDMKRELV